MTFIISYSADSNRPTESWTEEVHKNRDEAEQAALELLYSGYYVRLDEQE